MDRRGEIAQQVSVIMPQIARAIVMQIEQTFDLTPAQIFLLMALEEHDGVRISDLSRMMNVTAPTMTGIISRLEVCKHVLREHDAKDRRVVRVHLTSKGKTTVRRVRQIAQKRWFLILEKLSIQDCERYLTILEKVLKQTVRQKL